MHALRLALSCRAGHARLLAVSRAPSGRAPRFRIGRFSEKTAASQELKTFRQEDPRWTMKRAGDADLKLIKDEIQAAEAAVRENFGDNRYEIARTLNDMGLVFMQTNKFEKAEQYLLRAVEILLQLQHSFQFQALENLVGLYFQQGMYENGLPWLKRKIEAYETTQEKPGLEQYRNDLWNASEAHWIRGELADSASYLLKILALAIQDRGEESESVATVRQELGITYIAMGRGAEAVDEFRKARQIARARYGTSHDRFARALALEAQGLLAQGDTTGAIKLQQQALGIRESLQPPNPLLVALGLSELADSHLRASHLTQALQYRKKEEQVLAQALQLDSHPKLQSVRKAMAELEQRLRDKK